MVYFIQLENTPYVKIGFTGDDCPSRRINKIQSENPHPIKIIGTCDGDRRTESHYHALFRCCRVRGDWFNAENPRLSKFLEEKFPKTSTQPS